MMNHIGDFIINTASEVFHLIFSGNSGTAIETDFPVLVFAIACSFMGTIVVLLDWLIVVIGRESVLKLTYRGRYSIMLFLYWGVGAGIAGFLGGAFEIFVLDRPASIVVGATWPLVLPRIVRAAETTDEGHEDFEGEDS